MEQLLSPVLTKKLSNFKLAAKQIVRGGHKGERRSQRLGSSLEFSDYRLYHPGDDIRQIDWNTYARTQKYYIKRFLDEQELAVSIYLDCTKSMGIAAEKWLRTKQLAAVFTFLSLANSDRLTVVPVASESRSYPFTKGKAMTNKVIASIQQMSLAIDNKRFGTELHKIVSQARSGGLSIVISDFLDDPGELFQALKSIQAKRQQLLLIQIILPEEEDPAYVGDLKLVDLETGGERNVSMNRKVIEQYKQRYKAHVVKLKAFCNGRGIDLISCPTSQSIEEAVFSTIMSKGWIVR